MFGTLRRKAAIVAASGFAVAGLAFGAAGAASASTIGCQNDGTGYCSSQQLKFGHLNLDVKQQAAKYGQPVIWWTHSSSDVAQDWYAKNYDGQSGSGGLTKTFEYDPNGHRTGLCLAFPTAARNTRGVLRTCNEGPWQTFTPQDGPYGYVVWVNKASGMALEDAGFQNAGTQVNQYDVNGGDNQLVRWVP